MIAPGWFRARVAQRWLRRRRLRRFIALRWELSTPRQRRAKGLHRSIMFRGRLTSRSICDSQRLLDSAGKPVLARIRAGHLRAAAAMEDTVAVREDPCSAEDPAGSQRAPIIATI